MEKIRLRKENTEWVGETIIQIYDREKESTLKGREVEFSKKNWYIFSFKFFLSLLFAVSCTCHH